MGKTWSQAGKQLICGEIGMIETIPYKEVYHSDCEQETHPFEHIAKTIIINASKYVFMKLFVARDSGKQKIIIEHSFFDCFLCERQLLT